MEAERAFTGYGERLKAFMAQASADETAFNRLALELFTLQFEHVPVYQSLCRRRGATPGSVKDWKEIPALPTEAFKEFEVTSLPAAERATVFYSSGTTAENRSRHFHAAASLRIYEVSLLGWFGRHFLPDSAALTLILLTPGRAAAPHSSLAYMFDTIAETFPWRTVATAGLVGADGAWEVDAAQVERAARESAGPVAIMGTAYGFVHLLDKVGRLPLPPGSRALETGGYKGRSREMSKVELHELMRRRLRLAESHIISEYGMSELSSQAYDRTVGGSGGVFHFPPWARAQLISPETGRLVAEGEAGMVRVLDLANVRSVLAVQTSDVAVRRGEGFELMGRATAAEPRGCSLMTI
ncbi:MAG TPA: hypothetical protein VHB20_05150 [Verrucomicrobiae bacterium]|nr:hypothetical protein [Verrucomicrobiae bacterium]